MSGRAIFEKSMGEGKGSQRWFKDEIFDVLRERGIDPFMVIGFKDFDTPSKTVPLASFYGGDLGDFLMLIGSACEMLSKMYTKATPLIVADAVKGVLELKHLTELTGLPVTKEDVNNKMVEILEKFGDIATDEADTERVE